MKYTITGLLLLFTILFLFPQSTQAASTLGNPITTTEVEYASPDGVVLKGYIAYDQKIKGKEAGRPCSSRMVGP